MPAESSDHYDALEVLRKVSALAERAYPQDLVRMMACQNAIDGCLNKASTDDGEVDETIIFVLYSALKSDFPEVIAHVNSIVDDYRQQHGT